MSQSASNYARIEGDRYYTPAWVTQALIGAVTFDGMVLDPAAGAGNIVDAFTACGQLAEGTDIAPDAIHVRGPLDYLTAVANDVRNIVTNPPYGRGGRTAVAFIAKALADTEKSRGKVAMLLRVDFDSASGRRHIFGDHPAFAGKFILTRRIRWANLEQKASGPTENHAWFLWDWSPRFSPVPSLGYLHTGAA